MKSKELLKNLGDWGVGSLWMQICLGMQCCGMQKATCQQRKHNPNFEERIWFELLHIEEVPNCQVSRIIDECAIWFRVIFAAGKIQNPWSFQSCLNHTILTKKYNKQKNLKDEMYIYLVNQIWTIISWWFAMIIMACVTTEKDICSPGIEGETEVDCLGNRLQQ